MRPGSADAVGCGWSLLSTDRSQFMHSGVHYATKEQDGAGHSPFMLPLQSTGLGCGHRALRPSVPSQR